MLVAQYGVLDGVSDHDFDWQLQTCSARVLIVLVDTIQTTEQTQLRLAKERREELILRLFQQCDF